MRKLRYILEYILNVFLGPKHYFNFLGDIGGDKSEALMLLLVSGGLYGALNSIRSLIISGVGEYATISTLQEAVPVATTNFVSGFQFFAIMALIIFTVMHVTAFISGLRGVKNTFFALAYASPAINGYIGALVAYELFRKFVIGFPLIKYMLALVSLVFIGYVLSKGVETFHDASSRKSALVAAAPILVIIVLQVAVAVSVFISLMSAMQ